jgi:hypothetical protein
LQSLSLRWLRGAGFDLHTRKGNRPEGEQVGFSVVDGRIRGHVDRIVAADPQELGIGVPALWACKMRNAKNWRETRKSNKSEIVSMITGVHGQGGASKGANRDLNRELPKKRKRPLLVASFPPTMVSERL